MFENILPIGSVVKLKDSKQLLMIITRFPIVTFNGKDGYFDYGGCFYPQGFYNNQHFFFNYEDIGEICFYGYKSNDELKFLSDIEKDLQNIDYHHFTMAELSSDNVK